MRHTPSGNCLPVGGFCTTVNDEICDALHQAHEMGKIDGFEEIFNTLKVNEE